MSLSSLSMSTIAPSVGNGSQNGIYRRPRATIIYELCNNTITITDNTSVAHH